MIFKIISPAGVPQNPVLFPMMKPTFLAEAHNFVDNVEFADVILFDLHTRIADYDEKEIDAIVGSGKPVVTFDEWDRGGMSLDFWPDPLTKQMEQILQKCFSGGVKSVHFCRLLDKKKKYLPNLYPYEKPILHEEPIVSADDLFNRTFDIVWIANTAPQRERLAKALRVDSRLKCNIILGAKKIPFQDWVNEHKKGKFFISCSAGGYSNECVQALFSVSAQLKEINDQLLLHPFTNGVNSVMISDEPTKEQLDYLVHVVNNKDELYKIYLNNVQHMRNFYTKEYIAKDILGKIIKHCA